MSAQIRPPDGLIRVYVRFAFTPTSLTTSRGSVIGNTLRVFFAFFNGSSKLFFLVVCGITTVHGRPPLRIRTLTVS